MALYQIDQMLDQALEYLKDQATYVCVCTSSIDASKTYNNAYYAPDESPAGYCLARAAVTVGAAQDGATQGRRVVIPQYSDQTVLYSGTAARIVLIGTNLAAANVVLLVAECTAKALVEGDFVTIPSFSVTINDAA